MAPQDQIPLATSTYFCEGVQAQDKYDYGFIYLYVFPHTPPLTLWQKFNVKEEFTVASNNYKYWSFYMNHGSQVNVSLCAQPGIGLYVLKGKDNFDKWKKDDDYDSVSYSYYSGPCSNGINGFNPIRVRSGGEYYFVFESKTSVQSDINMTLAFNRTMYNVSAVSGKMCHANPTCSLPLSYASSQFTLIVTNGTVQSDENVDSQWACSSRDWFYGVTFGIVSGVLLVVAIGIVLQCWIKHGQHRTGSPPLLVSTYGHTGGISTSLTTTTLPAGSDPPNYEQAQKM